MFQYWLLIDVTVCLNCLYHHQSVKWKQDFFFITKGSSLFPWCDNFLITHNAYLLRNNFFVASKNIISIWLLVCSCVTTVFFILTVHLQLPFSVPAVPLYLLFLCSCEPTVPLYLCTHCSSVPTVPLYLHFPFILTVHWQPPFSVPAVPLYPLLLCSCEPTVPLNLCTHCSSVPTVPLYLHFLCTFCSSAPNVPLYLVLLCTHCSSVTTVPLCLLFLCTHWSTEPTVPLYLLFLCTYCSSVPVNPLFLCADCTHCSSERTVPLFLSCVPTVPLHPVFLCTHYSSVPVYPVSLCFFASTVPAYLLFMGGYYPLMFNYLEALYIRDDPTWEKMTKIHFR